MNRLIPLVGPPTSGEPKLKRTRVSACLLSVALTAALLWVSAPAALAARPKCFGKKATIVGTAGNDTLRGTRRADVIVGKGGHDVIIGRGGNDLICGNGGQDAIRGDGGSDKMNGGKGQDKVYYNSARSGVTVNLPTGRATGGSGTDVLKGFEDVVGSRFSDTITGNARPNLLSALEGDDTINGGAGIDILEGGFGNDTLDGGRAANGSVELNIVWYESSFATNGPSGPVTVDLGAGTGIDPDGSDTLTNLNTVVGSKYADQLTGDGSDNFILGQGGDDAINGGGGFDVSIYWFAPAAVTVDLLAGTASGGDGNDSLTGIEGIFGSNTFGDTLTGDAQNNFIDGSGGNDIIDGGAGGDWLTGGDGTDQINGGASAGQAFDLVDYSFNFGGPVNANLQTGTVTGLGNDGTPTDDTVTGVEGVFGTLFDDTLTGDANGNFLFGWIGNDTIAGGAGDDALDGGFGYFDANFNFFQTGEVDVVDGGDGTDSCSAAETPTACESTATPPTHPLSADAEAVQTLRRRF